MAPGCVHAIQDAVCISLGIAPVGEIARTCHKALSEAKYSSFGTGVGKIVPDGEIALACEQNQEKDLSDYYGIFTTAHGTAVAADRSCQRSGASHWALSKKAGDRVWLLHSFIHFHHGGTGIRHSREWGLTSTCELHGRLMHAGVGCVPHTCFLSLRFIMCHERRRQTVNVSIIPLFLPFRGLG